LAAPADMSKGGNGRYVLPVKFGLGGVPLGNEFEVVSDEDAYKTLEAAWNAGVRYYDVSPWYGLGLAERRYSFKEPRRACVSMGITLCLLDPKKAKSRQPIELTAF
jgi:Aldo/keto reductase family